MNEDFKYQFKIILIGNANSGKSCFIHQYLEKKCVEFGSKIIQNPPIKLQIWDTAGQERFRSIARTYYRGAQIAMILFDLTNSDSFFALNQWIQDARNLCSKDIIILVVGNKLDMYDERVITKVDASVFCSQQNVLYMEVSALTGENIDACFNMVIKQLMDNIQNGTQDDKQFLPPGIQNQILQLQLQKQRNGCCIQKYWK